MKPFKVVYAPLACMEDDDDDALGDQASSIILPTLPSQTSSSQSNTGHLILKNLENTPRNVAQTRYFSDSNKQCDDEDDKEYDYSNSTTSLLSRSSASKAKGLSWNLKTDPVLKRNALERQGANMNSGPSEDSATCFLQSAEVCDSAKKAAGVEGSALGHGGDVLLEKPDSVSFGEILDICHGDCLHHRLGDDNDNSDCKTHPLSGTRNSGVLSRSSSGPWEKYDANYDLLIQGKELCSIPHADDVSTLASDNSKANSASSLPDYITALQQVGGETLRPNADAATGSQSSEQHLDRSSRQQKDIGNKHLQCLDVQQHGASLEKISLSEPAKPDDDVNEEDDDEIRSGLELFLPSRRRHSAVSRVRLVAFLLKYILFVLNFFFWVTSVAAIVIGAWVLSERGQLVRDPAAFFLDPNAMLCLLGAITFLVAFCGCLGALRENICLLKLFQFSMMSVLALEALVALMVFAFYQMPEFRKQLKTGPEEVLTIAIRRYHDDDELRRWIDLIQKEFKCCGAQHSEMGYKDWQLNPYFNCTPDNPSVQRCGVPRSCCIIEPGEYINHMCGFDTTNKQRSHVFDRIYTQGCTKGLGQWLSAHDVAIGAVSLAIIVPQIVCVVLARLLVQHIKRQRVRWRVLHNQK